MKYSVYPLKSRISIFSIGLFYVLLLALIWLLLQGRVTQGIDQLLHDTWVRALQREPPQDVVIVGIDPASLEQLGRWPWPRDLQARIFSRLASSGARAVALDLLYVEADSNPQNDIRLADAITRLPLVVLPVLGEGRLEFEEKLPLPAITQQSESLGHISIPLDSDGIVRRINLKAGYRSAHWSALSLALAESIGEAPNSLPGRRLAVDLAKPWIEDFEVLIPFYGAGGSFNRVSAVDVLSGNVAEGSLQDKIVFVGMTATGLGDVLPTAVSAKNMPMPGVEIHANVFSALREGSLITAVDARWNYIVGAVLLLVILLLYTQLPPLWGLCSAVVLCLVPVLISAVLYQFCRFWYPPFSAVVPIILSYFVWSWHRLEFAADFLRRETDRLIHEVPGPDNTDNERLAQFFDFASQLLPVKGWRFISRGQAFRGGAPLPETRTDIKLEQWTNSGDVFSKRFSTTGRLLITFEMPDHALAREFSSYIDSLARIKERQINNRLSGSIERLQSHTYQLKFQLDRLRQLKALSDSIFSGSPAGLVVWNGAGEPVTHNTLAVRMLPDLDLMSLSLSDFLYRIDRDPLKHDKEAVQQLLMGCIPWQINRVAGEQEHVINFNATGQTLADRLVAASIVDVTDIRRSERTRGELIDYMSHDLRSPLISSLYLLEDSTTGARPMEMASRIERNINRSLKLIDDLLSLARADNLTVDVFQPVLFDSVLDNAADQLIPQARSRGIELTLEGDSEDFWIEGDANLLERAIINVLGNAIKYSPDDSTVVVSTNRVGPELVVRVRDHGVGIDPDMHERIFQRFKRDASVARTHEGLGLGLALVSRVVTQHRGRVSVESPAVGTVIEIRLPLAPSLADAG